MECRDVRKHISGYVADALQEGLREAVAAHIERCQECGQIAKVERLLTAPPAEPPSPARRIIALTLRDLEAGADAARKLWSDLNALRAAAEEAPIVKIAHAIIEQAIRGGAAALRLLPREDSVSVVYEVGAHEAELAVMPKYIEAPLIARFKKMAGLDVAPVRESCSGEIAVRMGRKDYRLLVRVSPSEFGEEVDVRIALE
jgi:type II secretory ATPase GspE/PulE/Tfp pilus assembly ATPase PilB-like protein